MADNTLKAKISALNKATESFRRTKKEYIRKICAVGIGHKWLKYPMLFVAFLFILFSNAAFYTALWVILNKRKAIGLAISAVALVGIFFIVSDYYESDRVYQEAIDKYTVSGIEVVDNTNPADPGKSNKEASIEEGAGSDAKTQWSWSDAISVDFDELQAINSDVVGWIYFENEDISYPIVQCSDNERYMSVSYDKQSSRGGSIFMDCENNPDFNDFHTIVYGHNMRNLSMFGKLRYYYNTENYFDDHMYFQIITPQVAYRYQIVSYKHVPANDSVYRVKELDGDKGIDFVKNVLTNNSMMNMSFEATDLDHYITLSTCSYDDNRFVVSAIRIDEAISDFER